MAEHLVHVRYYADGNEIMNAHLAAVGGTPHITDNGDGTYDIWSDEACTFIGIASGDDDYYGYYYSYEFNVTKAEVLSGHTLTSTYHDFGDGNNAALFAGLTDLSEAIWHGAKNLTTFSHMFASCSALKTLVPSEFFSGCRPVSAAKMFSASGDASLDIIFTGCDLSAMTSMDNMFNGCSAGGIIDFSNTDLGSVSTAKYCFYAASAKEISMANCGLGSLVDVSGFFSNAAALKKIIFTGCDLSGVTNWEWCFTDCSSLEVIFPFDFMRGSAPQNMRYCFSGTNLKHLCFEEVEFSNADLYRMFYNASSLECLTNLNTLGAVIKDDMFYGCDNLVQPDSTMQDSLSGSNGDFWVNSSPCQGVRAFLQKEDFPHRRFFRQSEHIFADMRDFIQKELYPQVSGFSQTEYVFSVKGEYRQSEAMLSSAQLFRQTETYRQPRKYVVSYFKQIAHVDRAEVADTLIKIKAR